MTETIGNTTLEDRRNFLAAELDVFVGPYEFNDPDDREGTFVLDVRSTDSFGEGHLPAASNIPRNELTKKMDAIRQDKAVVVYCSDIGCHSSRKAALTLMNEGHENVRVLFGGFEAWQKKGFDVETGGAAPEAPTATQ
jgi:rhodanese-related sulfurtransferase